jgi:hypothetical protein
MMVQVRGFWEYTDIAAGFLRSTNWIYSAGGLGALEAAIQAATNSNLMFATFGLPTVGTTTPSDSDYPLVNDLALFNFQTTPGSGVQLTIPAPRISMFGPQLTVIDPTATLSAAVIAAVIGTLGDAAGNPVTAFISGSKSSRKVDQVNG